MTKVAPSNSPEAAEPQPVSNEELDRGIVLEHQGFDRARSEWGEFFTAIGIDSEGKLRSLGLYQAALKSKVRSLRPKPGEKIAYRRLENRTSTSGRTYRNWSVRAVDRPLMTELPRTEDDEVDEGLEYEPPPDSGESY